MLPDPRAPGPTPTPADAAGDACPRCGTLIPAADTACAGCGFAVTPRRDDPAAAGRGRRFGLPRMAVGAIVVSTIEMAVLLWLLFGRRR